MGDTEETSLVERPGEDLHADGQAGAIKPDPAIFRHLAERLELPPEQVLYAGDNAVPDVLGPRQAGMKAAWINRANKRRPRRVPAPDFRLRSLTELLPHLLRGL